MKHLVLLVALVSLAVDQNKQGNEGGLSTGVANGSVWVSNAVSQPGGHQIKAVIDVTDQGFIGNGSTDNTTAAKTILTAIGATQTTILFPAGMYVLGSVTFPTNVALDFTKGAMLSPSTGHTITIAGPILASPTRIFTNIASGQGAISFAGNRTLTRISPLWFGLDCSGVRDNAPIWNQIVSITGDDSTFILPQNCVDMHASTVTVSSRAGFKLISEDRAQNGGGNQRPQFIWTGSSGGMWDFQANQAPTVEGFLFFNNDGVANHNVDYYIRLDGNPAAHIGTEGMIRYNTFTSNTNNPNFVAVTISPISGNNHEKNVVTDNDFVCSQSSALLETNSGSITSGSNVLTCGAGNCAFLTDANVGDRVRVSYAGQSPTLSSVGILDTTVSSITDNDHIVMAANAAATQTNARVHFRQAYGIGIYIGSVNAKHNTVERDSFTQCSSGLNIKNGSFSAAHFGGSVNDELVHIDNISEASELAYLEDESSLREVYLGNLDSYITLSHLRNMESSNGLGLAGGPLSNGYIYINQAAHVTMRDSIIQNTPVTNAVLIGAAAPGSTSFVSIGNQWTPGTGSGMSMANTGFSQWRTAAESGSVQGGFLISCGDSGILDTPGACFQFGEGGSLIGSEGHIVVSSAHPNNTASFNVFTAEPNSTSTGFVNEARGFQTKINGFNNSTSMTWVPFDVTWMSGVRGGNYGGYRSVFPVVASTTMPSARGFWIKAPASSSAITTAEGYYSEDICGAGGIGTCYAFHSVGANDLVSAAGPGSFKTVTSTVATGTAPLAVTSTTPVANLTVSNHPTLDDCGTTSTCSATQKTAALIVRGSVAFPTATTVTVTSLPFTSSSSYSCTAGDQTNPAGVVNATTYASGSSVTFTETNGVNTDTIRYICVGF